MPELPEVETTRAGIEPHLLKHRVTSLVIRNRQLRWPIPQRLASELSGATINSVSRRGKYLLLETDAGTALLHLGMSGSLRVVDAKTPAQKHDHVDIVLDSGQALRFHDPRRFGCLLWTRKDPMQHELLASLGPEPLGKDFNADILFDKAKGKKLAVKSFIMDSKVVVGVGNIYANEALARAIVDVLSEAITQGGTTLRDFVNSEGKPGYFQQTLAVYGREGEACVQCGNPLHTIRLGQRSTYYCAHCQT